MSIPAYDPNHQNTPPSQNPTHIYHQFECEVKCILREFRNTSRQLREDEITRLVHRYDTMKDLHTSSAWKLTLSVIGSVFGMYSTGTEKDSALGILLTKSGDMLDNTGKFLLKFDERDTSRAQGCISELQEALSDLNSQNRAIDDLLRDMHSLLEEARRKTNDANKALMNG